MIRLYCPELGAPAPAQWQLTDPQQHHYLTRVLRVKIGDRLSLFNQAIAVSASITAIGKHSLNCELLVATAMMPDSPLHSHLGICCSRGERMDYSIQKSTELGVNVITPLFNQSCQVSPRQATSRLAHWQGVAVHAAQQCGRCSIPTIHNPQQLAHWLAEVQAERKLVLDEQASSNLKTEPRPASVVLLIGPEGGLNQDEIHLAQAHQFATVRLGPRVLRCESAPPVAMGILQYLWGDLNQDIKSTDPNQETLSQIIAK